jgi:hypothetical protein
MLNNPTANQALPISRRTVFLSTDGIRAARGISTDKVKQMVDDGGLLWVFNLGRLPGDGHIRHLRFWLPEILDASAVAKLGIEEVVSKIIPAGRRTVNGSELGQWFLISRPTVSRIGRETGGKLKNRVWHVEREALANYLRSRWIGGLK